MHLGSMEKFLLFLFYLACMLGMVFLIVSGALGGFRPAWRYMGILIRHITALAALGIMVAAIIGWWVN